MKGSSVLFFVENHCSLCLCQIAWPQQGPYQGVYSLPPSNYGLRELMPGKISNSLFISILITMKKDTPSKMPLDSSNY